MADVLTAENFYTPDPPVKSVLRNYKAPKQQEAFITNVHNYDAQNNPYQELGKYDQGLALGSVQEYVRGENQAFYVQAANGLTKAIANNALKIPYGLVESVSLLTAMTGGAISGEGAVEAANRVGTGFGDAYKPVDDWFKETFPVYSTEAYGEGNSVEKLASAKFLFGDLADGVGYVASQFFAGKAVASGVKAGIGLFGKAIGQGAAVTAAAEAGTAYGLTQMVAKAPVIGAKMEQIFNATKKVTGGTQAIVGSTVNSVYEASSEGYDAAQQVKAQYDALIQQAQLLGDTERVDELSLKKDLAVDKAQASIFTTNMLLLTLGTNLFQMKLLGDVHTDQKTIRALARLGKDAPQVKKRYQALLGLWSEGLTEENIQSAATSKTIDKYGNPDNIDLNDKKYASETYDDYLDDLKGTMTQSLKNLAGFAGNSLAVALMSSFGPGKYSFETEADTPEDEAFLAMAIGGAIGSGMGMYHGAKKQASIKAAYAQHVSLMDTYKNYAPTVNNFLYDNVKASLKYKKDAPGELQLDEASGLPEIDFDKVGAIARNRTILDSLSREILHYSNENNALGREKSIQQALMAHVFHMASAIEDRDDLNFIYDQLTTEERAQEVGLEPDFFKQRRGEIKEYLELFDTVNKQFHSPDLVSKDTVKQAVANQVIKTAFFAQASKRAIEKAFEASNKHTGRNDGITPRALKDAQAATDAYMKEASPLAINNQPVIDPNLQNPVDPDEIELTGDRMVDFANMVSREYEFHDRALQDLRIADSKLSKDLVSQVSRKQQLLNDLKSLQKSKTELETKKTTTPALFTTEDEAALEKADSELKARLYETMEYQQSIGLDLIKLGDRTTPKLKDYMTSIDLMSGEDRIDSKVKLEEHPKYIVDHLVKSGALQLLDDSINDALQKGGTALDTLSEIDLRGFATKLGLPANTLITDALNRLYKKAAKEYSEMGKVTLMEEAKEQLDNALALFETKYRSPNFNLLNFSEILQDAIQGTLSDPDNSIEDINFDDEFGVLMGALRDFSNAFSAYDEEAGSLYIRVLQEIVDSSEEISEENPTALIDTVERVILSEEDLITDVFVNPAMQRFAEASSLIAAYAPVMEMPKQTLNLQIKANKKIADSPFSSSVIKTFEQIFSFAYSAYSDYNKIIEEGLTDQKLEAFTEVAMVEASLENLEAAAKSFETRDDLDDPDIAKELLSEIERLQGFLTKLKDIARRNLEGAIAKDEFYGTVQVNQNLFGLGIKINANGSGDISSPVAQFINTLLSEAGKSLSEEIENLKGLKYNILSIGVFKNYVKSLMTPEQLTSYKALLDKEIEKAITDMEPWMKGVDTALGTKDDYLKNPNSAIRLIINQSRAFVEDTTLFSMLSKLGKDNPDVSPEFLMTRHNDIAAFYLNVQKMLSEKNSELKAKGGEKFLDFINNYHNKYIGLLAAREATESKVQISSQQLIEVIDKLALADNINLSTQQQVVVLEILDFIMRTEKFDGKDFSNAMYLNGAVGSGKSTTMALGIRVAMELGILPKDSLKAIAHADFATNSINNKLGITSFGTNLQDKLNNLKEGDLLIVDEAPALTNTVLFEIDKISREKKAKVMFLGDLSQISPESDGSVLNQPSRNPSIKLSSPLSIIYRTNLMTISSAILSFRDKRSDVESISTEASVLSGSYSPISFGVTSTNREATLKIVAKPSSRSRVVILNNVKEVDKFKKELEGLLGEPLAARPDLNLEVLSALDAQGMTKDEAFILLDKNLPNQNGTSFTSPLEFNTMMYSSIGRGSLFVAIAPTATTVSSSLSTSLNEEVETPVLLKQIQANFDFNILSAIQSLKRLLNVDVKTTRSKETPKGTATTPPAKPNTSSTPPEPEKVNESPEEEIVEDEQDDQEIIEVDTTLSNETGELIPIDKRSERVDEEEEVETESDGAFNELDLNPKESNIYSLKFPTNSAVKKLLKKSPDTELIISVGNVKGTLTYYISYDTGKKDRNNESIFEILAELGNKDIVDPKFSAFFSALETKAKTLNINQLKTNYTNKFIPDVPFEIGILGKIKAAGGNKLNYHYAESKDGSTGRIATNLDEILSNWAEGISKGNNVSLDWYKDGKVNWEKATQSVSIKIVTNEMLNSGMFEDYLPQTGIPIVIINNLYDGGKPHFIELHSHVMGTHPEDFDTYINPLKQFWGKVVDIENKLNDDNLKMGKAAFNKLITTYGKAVAVRDIVKSTEVTIDSAKKVDAIERIPELKALYAEHGFALFNLIDKVVLDVYGLRNAPVYISENNAEEIKKYSAMGLEIVERGSKSKGKRINSKTGEQVASLLQVMEKNDKGELVAYRETRPTLGYGKIAQAFEVVVKGMPDGGLNGKNYSVVKKKTIQTREGQKVVSTRHGKSLFSSDGRSSKLYFYNLRQRLFEELGGEESVRQGFPRGISTANLEELFLVNKGALDNETANDYNARVVSNSEVLENIKDELDNEFDSTITSEMLSVFNLEKGAPLMDNKNGLSKPVYKSLSREQVDFFGRTAQLSQPRTREWFGSHTKSSFLGITPTTLNIDLNSITGVGKQTVPLPPTIHEVKKMNFKIQQETIKVGSEDLANLKSEKDITKIFKGYNKSELFNLVKPLLSNFSLFIDTEDGTYLQTYFVDADFKQNYELFMEEPFVDNNSKLPITRIYAPANASKDLVMHEMIHAITMKALLEPKTPTEMEFAMQVTMLQRIYNETMASKHIGTEVAVSIASNKLNDRNKVVTITEVKNGTISYKVKGESKILTTDAENLSIKQYYESTSSTLNTLEFVASLSNKDFRNNAKSIVLNKKSLLQNFYEAVVKLFGLKESTNVYDATIESIRKLYETEQIAVQEEAIDEGLALYPEPIIYTETELVYDNLIERADPYSGDPQVESLSEQLFTAMTNDNETLFNEIAQRLITRLDFLEKSDGAGFARISKANTTSLLREMDMDSSSLHYKNLMGTILYKNIFEDNSTIIRNVKAIPLVPKPGLEPNTKWAKTKTLVYNLWNDVLTKEDKNKLIKSYNNKISKAKNFNSQDLIVGYYSEARKKLLDNITTSVVNKLNGDFRKQEGEIERLSLSIFKLIDKTSEKEVYSKYIKTIKEAKKNVESIKIKNKKESVDNLKLFPTPESRAFAAFEVKKLVYEFSSLLSSKRQHLNSEYADSLPATKSTIYFQVLNKLQEKGISDYVALLRFYVKERVPEYTESIKSLADLTQQMTLLLTDISLLEDSARTIQEQKQLAVLTNKYSQLLTIHEEIAPKIQAINTISLLDRNGLSPAFNALYKNIYPNWSVENATAEEEEGAGMSAISLMNEIENNESVSSNRGISATLNEFVSLIPIKELKVVHKVINGVVAQVEEEQIVEFLSPNYVKKRLIQIYSEGLDFNNIDKVSEQIDNYKDTNVLDVGTEAILNAVSDLHNLSVTRETFKTAENPKAKLLPTNVHIEYDQTTSLDNPTINYIYSINPSDNVEGLTADEVRYAQSYGKMSNIKIITGTANNLEALYQRISNIANLATGEKNVESPTSKVLFNTMFRKAQANNLVTDMIVGIGSLTSVDYYQGRSTEKEGPYSLVKNSYSSIAKAQEKQKYESVFNDYLASILEGNGKIQNEKGEIVSFGIKSKLYTKLITDLTSRNKAINRPAIGRLLSSMGFYDKLKYVLSDETRSSTLNTFKNSAAKLLITLQKNHSDAVGKNDKKEMDTELMQVLIGDLKDKVSAFTYVVNFLSSGDLSIEEDSVTSSNGKKVYTKIPTSSTRTILKHLFPKPGIKGLKKFDFVNHPFYQSNIFVNNNLPGRAVFEGIRHDGDRTDYSITNVARMSPYEALRKEFELGFLKTLASTPTVDGFKAYLSPIHQQGEMTKSDLIRVKMLSMSEIKVSLRAMIEQYSMQFAYNQKMKGFYKDPYINFKELGEAIAAVKKGDLNDDQYKDALVEHIINQLVNEVPKLKTILSGRGFSKHSSDIYEQMDLANSIMYGNDPEAIMPQSLKDKIRSAKAAEVKARKRTETQFESYTDQELEEHLLEEQAKAAEAAKLAKQANTELGLTEDQNIEQDEVLDNVTQETKVIPKYIDQNRALDADFLYPSLYAFVLNRFVNSTQLSQLVYGDFRLYPDIKTQHKRSQGPNSPGYIGRIHDAYGMKATSKILVVKDIMSPISKTEAFLEQFFPRESEEFKDVLSFFNENGFEATDGSSFITPRYGYVLRKAFGSNLALGNILKDQYYGPSLVDSTTVNEAGETSTSKQLEWSYLKNSIVVITEELAAKHPGLRKIALYLDGYTMDANGKITPHDYGEQDILCYHSGNKVALPNADDAIADVDAIDSELRFNSNIREIDNRFFKMQFNPLSTDKTTALPRQFTYYTLSHSNNREASGAIHKALAGLELMGATEFMDKLGVDLNQMSKAVSSMIDPNSTNLPLKRLLEAGLDPSNPIVEAKILSTLASTLDKGVTSHRLTGGKLVLQSAEGMTNPQTKQPLKYFVDEHGMPTAEALLPSAYLSEAMKEALEKGEDVFAYADILGFRIPTSEMHSAVKIKVVGYYDNSSKTNIAVLPEQLIPIQGWDFDIDSLFIVRRTDFKTLPRFKEFVKINDINYYPNDHVGYTYSKETKKYAENFEEFERDLITELKNISAEVARLKEEGNKKEIKESKQASRVIKKQKEELNNKIKLLTDIRKELYKNTIVENYLKVMSDKVNLERVVKPISTKYVDDVISMLKEEKLYINKEFGSSGLFTNDYESYKANSVSAIGIGIFANGMLIDSHLSHAKNKTIYDRIKVISKVGEEWTDRTRHNKFVEEIDVNGKMISIYSLKDTILNLYLDALKNPLLSEIGFTAEAAPLVDSAISLGIPFNTIVRIFNDPFTRQMLSEKAIKSMPTIYDKSQDETRDPFDNEAVIILEDIWKELEELNGLSKEELEDLKDTLEESNTTVNNSGEVALEKVTNKPEEKNVLVEKKTPDTYSIIKLLGFLKAVSDYRLNLQTHLKAPIGMGLIDKVKHENFRESSDTVLEPLSGMQRFEIAETVRFDPLQTLEQNLQRMELANKEHLKYRQDGIVEVNPDHFWDNPHSAIAQLSFIKYDVYLEDKLPMFSIKNNAIIDNMQINTKRLEMNRAKLDSYRQLSTFINSFPYVLKYANHPKVQVTASTVYEGHTAMVIGLIQKIKAIKAYETKQKVNNSIFNSNVFIDKLVTPSVKFITGEFSNIKVVQGNNIEPNTLDLYYNAFNALSKYEFEPVVNPKTGNVVNYRVSKANVITGKLSEFQTQLVDYLFLTGNGNLALNSYTKLVDPEAIVKSALDYSKIQDYLFADPEIYEAIKNNFQLAHGIKFPHLQATGAGMPMWLVLKNFTFKEGEEKKLLNTMQSVHADAAYARIFKNQELAQSFQEPLIIVQTKKKIDNRGEEVFASKRYPHIKIHSVILPYFEVFTPRSEGEVKKYANAFVKINYYRKAVYNDQIFAMPLIANANMMKLYTDPRPFLFARDGAIVDNTMTIDGVYAKRGIALGDKFRVVTSKDSVGVRNVEATVTKILTRPNKEDATKTVIEKVTFSIKDNTPDLIKGDFTLNVKGLTTAMLSTGMEKEDVDTIEDTMSPFDSGKANIITEPTSIHNDLIDNSLLTKLLDNDLRRETEQAQKFCK